MAAWILFREENRWELTVTMKRSSLSSRSAGFVEQIASESGKYGSKLLRHLRIDDTQIEYIALAFKVGIGNWLPVWKNLSGDGLAVALAARLLGKYSAHRLISKRRSVALPTFTLRRVTEYVDNNLTKDLTLAEIADVARMSPHYFSRAFRQSTGRPPHRYVMDRRIERAKTLLSNKNLPLVDVGLSVGFQNQSHFTALFHKRTGLTPKAYRFGTQGFTEGFISSPRLLRCVSDPRRPS